ncbi:MULTISPECIES: NAD(P)H-dependent oxidoreductase [unclassified Microcoleus]|uniref:NAD(P)H-dependent oxidoreductase n=1 Tax=unclassified Microcoleus TaxID=2642155 RepID=UPI002FD4E257
MAHILHIDSSPRGEKSHSRRLKTEFFQQWKQAHPADVVTYRDQCSRPSRSTGRKVKSCSNI